MKKLFLILMAIVLIYFGDLPSTNAAASSIAGKDLGKYFAGFTTGSFIMYDEANDRYLVYNETQSNKRLSPCSTFKIFMSLVGLQTGVLAQDDALTLVKWNGGKYPFPTWEHDQTLATATKDSVVWYFQELASRIGTERMQAYLNKLNYGNRDMSAGSTFWLGSSLQISAREQVDFLSKLSSGKLPVSPENLAIVKRNITVSESNGIRLMGKTGTAFQNVLGWFVGWVEKAGKRYFFATNIQAPNGASGPRAQEITKAILKELQVL